LSRLRLDASHLERGVVEAGISKLLRPGFEDGFKIVLTTYETLRDYEFSLARVAWGIVVCDEAQKIKNPAAFVTQAAKALRCDFRIACTGTPVENSLADLWCLFDFFQPGYLGSLNEFTKEFRRNIETRADGHLSLVGRLRSATRPWILRRMKNEVHRGLPTKIEGAKADPSSAALSMSTLQSALYRESVAAYRAACASDEEEAGSDLGPPSRLRMICANPLSVVSGDHESKPITEHLSTSPSSPG
jgi:SNF2 family DNA or RNA helicase